MNNNRNLHEYRSLREHVQKQNESGDDQPAPKYAQRTTELNQNHLNQNLNQRFTHHYQASLCLMTAESMNKAVNLILESK